MKKNGILTLLFALIPGAGEMYQGYNSAVLLPTSLTTQVSMVFLYGFMLNFSGLSLITMFCLSVALGAWMGIEIFYIGAPILYMYSFFDTFNLRAQIGLDAAPADDYLIHFDMRDRRLEQLMAERHKLLGWLLIAFGGMVAYQNIIMNTLGDLLWRWGKENPIFRALYLVMDQLPEVLVCVVLIVCGIWLVKGPRTAKKSAPKAESAEEDFTEYQPAPKKVNVQAILNSINRRSAEDDEAAAGEMETGDTTEGNDGIE